MTLCLQIDNFWAIMTCKPVQVSTCESIHKNKVQFWWSCRDSILTHVRILRNWFWKNWSISLLWKTIDYWVLTRMCSRRSNPATTTQTWQTTDKSASAITMSSVCLDTLCTYIRITYGIVSVTMKVHIRTHHPDLSFVFSWLPGVLSTCEYKNDKNN